MTNDAATFHRLHADGLLRLPNAWDAGTARVVESLGARAVATSSAAVAWSHGYQDGNVLPLQALLFTVSSIARAVRVPLSVDVEAGYSDDPARVAETVGAVIDAGAAGINLEDGAGDPALLCRKIEQVRGAAERRGVKLYINARTDLYLRPLVPPEQRVAEALKRAALYRGAGADGLFVPGITQAEEIRMVVAGCGMPLNVMARAGLPSADELQALGVRRLSAGSAIAEVVYGRVAALSEGFLKTGSSAPLLEGAMAYGEINAMMMPA